MEVSDAVFLLSVAVLVLSAAAALALASVPVILWRTLRQADEMDRLRLQAAKLREDVDKLDAVVDGMLSGRMVQ